MATWRWLRFLGAKAHAVTSDLAEVVTKDLVERECELDHDELVHSISIDMPGMISLNRPWTEAWVDGLKLEVPCEDVGTFVRMLEELEERIIGGRSVCKLHGFHKCVVLAFPEQRDALLASMRAALPDAERRASEYYAVHALPSEVLREAASKIHNIPLEQVPNLGANKQDRFRPGGVGGKTRGEA